MTFRARAGWGVGAALALLAAFPHPLFGTVVDGGLLFAWVAPALLLRALDGLAPRRAALWGFGISWAAYSAILHWIYVVTVDYGHAHPIVGLVAPIALASYIAAFGAGFAASQSWLAGRGLASVWSAAVTWTALDHLRSFALTGFPWATLGYAQHRNPLLLGLASFTGVYGLSFASVLGGAALFEIARALPKKPPPAVFAALPMLLALHGLGLAAPRPEPNGSVRVAVLQGNIDQGVKWSAAWIERTLSRYEVLSRVVAASGAEIIVWPETAVPGAIELDPQLRERLGALARSTGAALVVGGVGLELDATGRPAR